MEAFMQNLLQQQQESTRTLLEQQHQAFTAVIQSLNAPRRSEGSLVDMRGVGKPDVLRNKEATDRAAFILWLTKFVKWVTDGFPESSSWFEKLEGDNGEEITEEMYTTMVEDHPWVGKALGTTSGDFDCVYSR